MGDVGLLTADDQAILAHASHSQRAVVSADADFATLLAAANRSQPSLILLRSADLLTPNLQAHLILANLGPVAADLRDGCCCHPACSLLSQSLS